MLFSAIPLGLNAALPASLTLRNKHSLKNIRSVSRAQPCHQLTCKKRRQYSTVIVSVSAHDGAGVPYEGENGDSKLQAELMDMLQQEIQKAKSREAIEKNFEDRENKLRAAAEEAKASIEKRGELEKQRIYLDVNLSMSEINREADEYLEKLRISRWKRQRDLERYEKLDELLAAERSNGLFFKSLHQGNIKKIALKDIDPEIQQAMTLAHQQPMQSPFRIAIYGVLVLFTTASTVASVSTGHNLSAVFNLVLTVAVTAQFYLERSTLEKLDMLALGAMVEAKKSRQQDEAFLEAKARQDDDDDFRSLFS